MTALILTVVIPIIATAVAVAGLALLARWATAPVRCAYRIGFRAGKQSAERAIVSYARQRSRQRPHPSVKE